MGLKVTKSQLDALGQNAGEAFSERLVAQSRVSFEEALGEITDAELRAAVQEGIRKASAHGIHTQRGVSQFVNVSLAHGGNFDTQPWASTILQDKTLDATTKVNRLTAEAVTRPPVPTRNTPALQLEAQARHEGLKKAVYTTNRELNNETIQKVICECPELGFPPVFIDAHMHIQSGNCTPLPPLIGLVRDNNNIAGAAISLFSIGRGGVNKLGRLATSIGDTSSLSTDAIGAVVVKENDQLTHLAHPAQSSYLGMSIVLTMDMDFCHIDGYAGKPIYQKAEDGRWFYLERERGDQAVEQCKRQYIDDYKRETRPMEIEQKLMQAGSASPTDREARERELRSELERLNDNKYKQWQSAREDADPTTTNAQEVEEFFRYMNMDLYETWRRQRRLTEAAAVRHPLRLLPMYHYEPRRYITEDPHFPFTQVATPSQAGIYIGFKMYSSQGYMPSETTTAGQKIASIMEGYFSRCAREQIPIMTHCTPAGFYTHQRPLYIDLAPEQVRESYRRPDRKTLRNKDRMKYFKDHFVHPEAWRPVLERNPSLRLCLAHFASDSRLWEDAVADFDKPSLSSKQLHELDMDLEKLRLLYLQNASEHGPGQVYVPYNDKQFLDIAWTHPDFVKKYGTYVKPSMDLDGILYAKGWVRSIVELCLKYENFYTDLSYLPLWEELKNGQFYWNVLADILKKYPKMEDHIMFGTDWYLIQASKIKYKEWFSRTIEALQEVQKALGRPVDLFHKFAIVNPLKFYRLEEICDKLKAGFVARIEQEQGINQSRAKSELEERYLTLVRVKGKVDQMKSSVEQGPLKFSPTPPERPAVKS
jgi:hypothetical protein